MNSARIWLFRGLIVVAAGLMLFSWFMPWWHCDIWALQVYDAFIIHPWGLSISHQMGEYAAFTEGAEMPVWFAPLMWTYLGLCIALLLFSLLAKDKAVSLGKFRFSLPKVIIGGVGLSYIIVVVLAVTIAAIRTGDFYGTHLIGESYFHAAAFAEGYTYAGLLFGYWLACGVGPLLIVLALLRDKIIGKAKLITR